MKKSIRFILSILLVSLIMSYLLLSVSAATSSIPAPIIPFTTYTVDTLGGSYTWNVPVSTTGIDKPKMDVLYVIDTTGSMSGNRSTLASTVNSFNTDLVSAGATDIHWGVVYFGDMEVDNPWFGMSLSLGNYPIASVSNAISNLHQTDGGDTPEDACAAYMRTIAETPWREDAKHVIILVTDAPTKYADFADTARAIRSATLYGGYPITAEGAAKLTVVHSVQACLLTYYSPQLSGMSAALGVPETTWQNASQLQKALSVTVIAPYPEDVSYEARIISSTYKSDGTASSDLVIDVAPETILLKSGESSAFSFTAKGSLIPMRYGDTTVVEIGYYTGSIRFDSATQYIEYRIDALVTFKDWDGSILKVQSVDYGSGAIAPDDPDNKEGWHFDHWDTDFSKVTCSLEVTAVYLINEYIVEFIDWDGAVLKEETVVHGAAASAPNSPSRSGHRFTGWDPDDFSEITSNLVVTARYAVIPPGYEGWKIANDRGDLAPINITLARGRVVQFIALKDGVQVNDDVTWSIVNKQIATVSQTGLVTVSKQFVGQVALMLLDANDNPLTGITLRIVQSS
jgi:hypothetical protein